MIDKKISETIDLLIQKIKENNLGSIKFSNKTNCIEISNNSLVSGTNQTTQNIGARRLHTILERLLEELSFESAEMSSCTVEINEGFVNSRLKEVAADEDLSRYIL